MKAKTFKEYFETAKDKTVTGIKVLNNLGWKRSLARGSKNK